MPNQSSKKILVTGSTGLVGSRFISLYKNIFSITTIGRENTDKLINLESREDVINSIEESDSDYVINFAAYTKVDEAEKEKNYKDGEVYTINVLLPVWLATACKASGKKLFHISTDYVFDGKKEDNPYTEEDIPVPVDSWYAKTKYEGEVGIANITDNFVIIRISYPYSGVYDKKPDIVRTAINKLTKGESYLGITDQKIKPTSVDDIAASISLLLNKDSTGIYHVAGNFPDGYITPYNFALKIANALNFDSSLVKPVSFTELSKKRVAPRPQHTWLNTKKIESLGLNITGMDKALSRFKQQLIDSQKSSFSKI